MVITFKYPNSNSRNSLELLSLNKIHKLISKDCSLKRVDFFFKIDEIHQDKKYCGIRLYTKKNRFCVLSKGNEFENAIENTISELEELLKK